MKKKGRKENPAKLNINNIRKIQKPIDSKINHNKNIHYTHFSSSIMCHEPSQTHLPFLTVRGSLRRVGWLECGRQAAQRGGSRLITKGVSLCYGIFLGSAVYMSRVGGVLYRLTDSFVISFSSFRGALFFPFFAHICLVGFTFLLFLSWFHILEMFSFFS